MSTPFLLQDALVCELKEAFKDYTLNGLEGEPVHINVYPQSLPAKSEEDDLEHFPYILVRVLDGGTLSYDSGSTCKVGLFIGVYDEDTNYQGYKDVMNIIQKIQYHFMTQSIIGGKYVFQYPFDWAISSEDVYPYFFGGIETNWLYPTIVQGGAWD